ncbi:hypothetical protein OC845_001907 [Tilletia horrida]|nr:hypothetical protein OC845_001907 [Tilletia horrida]
MATTSPSSPSIPDSETLRLVIEVTRKQVINLSTDEVESVIENERSYYISVDPSAHSHVKKHFDQDEQDLLQYNPTKLSTGAVRAGGSDSLSGGSALEPADDEEEEGAYRDDDDIGRAHNHGVDPLGKRGAVSGEHCRQSGQLTKTQMRRAQRLRAAARRKAGSGLVSRLTDHWHPSGHNESHKRSPRWRRAGSFRAAEHWSPGHQTEQKDRLRKWNDERFAYARPRSASPTRC